MITECEGQGRPGRLATPGGRNRCPVTRSDTPCPVQVRRDAAEVERPAGAEQHRQVDVADVLGDDALVEHQPDLLGERVQRPAADLLLGRAAAPPG